MRIASILDLAPGTLHAGGREDVGKSRGYSRELHRIPQLKNPYLLHTGLGLLAHVVKHAAVYWQSVL